MAEANRSALSTVLAVVLGTLLVLGVAEGTLQIAALALRSPPPEDTGARYVILAEGDSFTYGVGGRSFPRQLEELLNERAGQPLFQIVNMGEPGLNTTGLVSRFEEHLDQIQPHLAIITIGENNTWNTYQPHSDALSWTSRLDMIASRSRLYRFFRVWLVGWNRSTFHEGSPTVREMGRLSTLPDVHELIGLPQEEEQIRGERETSAPTSYTPEQAEAYEAAFRLRDEGDYEASAEAFLALIEDAPDELAPYVGGAGALIRTARFQDAIDLVRRGLARLPEGEPLPDYAIHTLHLAYKFLGDGDQATRVLTEALHRDPTMVDALHALALYHHEIDGEVWRALDQVQDIPDIEENESYRYLRRLSEMTEGRVDTLQNLLSSTFQQDMETLAHAAHTRGVRSIWTSYPLHAYPEVASVARTFGIPYVDFRPMFAARFNDRSEFLAADGCHCNTAGYEFMAEILAEEVLRALEIDLPPLQR